MSPVVLTFTEAQAYGVGPRHLYRNPFDIIQHPFRVLVYDSDLQLIAVGTADMGLPTDPLSVARHYAESTPGYAAATILRRADCNVQGVLVKDPETTDASQIIPHADDAV